MAPIDAAPIDDAVRGRVLRALHGAGLLQTPFGSADDAPSDRILIRALEGGLGRRSYAVSVRGQTWAVRVPAEDRAGAIDVAAEAEITAEAASLGLAPRVVATDPGTGALITEHLDGAGSLAPEALKSPANIARVAELLRTLHTIRRGWRRFDPEGFATQYLASLNAAAALDATHRRRAAELLELARAYRARYPSIVLCHNDLVASNILDDGRLRLVDFEYAVIAAPVLDLAGIAAMNDFDAGERWHLVEAYYEDSAVPFTAPELVKVVRLVRLIAYFWALSSAAAVSESSLYAAFAERTAAALDTNKG